MNKQEKNKKGYITSLKNRHKKYSDFLSTTLEYAKRREYFDSLFIGSLEIRENTKYTGIDAMGFINLLILYGVIYEKTSDEKLYFCKNIEALEILDEFIFIAENNLSLTEYSRIKKLKKLLNEK